MVNGSSESKFLFFRVILSAMSPNLRCSQAGVDDVSYSTSGEAGGGGYNEKAPEVGTICTVRTLWHYAV